MTILYPTEPQLACMCMLAAHLGYASSYMGMERKDDRTLHGDMLQRKGARTWAT